MTIYILKEIISTKYNRSDEERFNRSIAFVIQNTTNGNLALFQLDRIAKKVAALRCNNRSCGHRLSIEHTKFRLNNFCQNRFRLIESFRMILILANLNEKNLLN